MKETTVKTLPRNVEEEEVQHVVEEMEGEGWTLVSKGPTITVTFEREQKDPEPPPLPENVFTPVEDFELAPPPAEQKLETNEDDPMGLFGTN